MFERNKTLWFNDADDQEQQLERLTSQLIEVYQQHLNEAVRVTTARLAAANENRLANIKATFRAKTIGKYGRQNGRPESEADLEIKLAKNLLGLNHRFRLVTKGPNQVKRDAVGPKIPVPRPTKPNTKKNPTPTPERLANLLQNHFSNYEKKSLKMVSKNAVSRTKIEITNLNAQNSTVLEITNLFLRTDEPFLFGRK